MMFGVSLKKLGAGEYEFAAHGWDYHVRKEGSTWILTAFDSSIEDPRAAFIDATDHATLREAVEYAASPATQEA